MADDLSTMSYEAALAELDEIIARLERGDVELEAAIRAYERGAALTRHCAQLLDRTEQKITQLVVGPAGEVERPFQPPTDAVDASPSVVCSPASGSTPMSTPSQRAPWCTPVNRWCESRGAA